MAAELSDIIVPRNLGTCSRVKLLKEVIIMAAKIQKIIEKAIDSQRFGTLVTLYANTPTRKPEKTVKGFLPNLFTNRPQIMLPRT